MSLGGDLTDEVEDIFSTRWETQSAGDIPATEDLRLKSNHAKEFQRATILYADLDGSTNMVDNLPWQISAEIYKTYLHCASEIIRHEEGSITAYDGDRVMAVFTGDLQSTSAVSCALKINYAVVNIIQPAFNAQYPSKDFTVKHVVGIDTSPLRAARIGVHGDNDLVWIGRAANYAAKLTTIPDKAIWITEAVYKIMKNSVKYANTSGLNMWTGHKWRAMNNIQIYGSSYTWQIL